MGSTSPNNELTDLQSVEYNLLLEFDRVCKKLDLRYFLSSGTLLGAVRHSGFIPWDDDIDVLMFRKDYDRFLKFAPAEIGPRYFLQTNESEKEYPFPFAKLRDSETTLIEKEVRDLNINQGIYIDIFPLDGIPTNKLLRNLGWVPLSIIGYLSLFKKVRKQTPHKLGIMFKILDSIIPIKAWTLSRMYVSLCKMCDVDKAKFVAFSSWPDYPFDLIVYRKSLFEETVVLNFHGRLFPAPSGYDELLKQLYGDYMVLPPEEKRNSHHRNVQIDTTKSYREYVVVERNRSQ